MAELASRGFGLVASFAAQARELSPALWFFVEVERVRGSHALSNFPSLSSLPNFPFTLSHLQILFF
jgi:hypothetical protein